MTACKTKLDKQFKNKLTAVNLFLNCLSNFVLHAVMMVGARQGVYLSGGIIPRLLPYFEESAFAARLSEYGIFTDYIAAVPVWPNGHSGNIVRENAIF